MCSSPLKVHLHTKPPPERHQDMLTDRKTVRLSITVKVASWPEVTWQKDEKIQKPGGFQLKGIKIIKKKNPLSSHHRAIWRSLVKSQVSLRKIRNPEVVQKCELIFTTLTWGVVKDGCKGRIKTGFIYSLDPVLVGGWRLRVLSSKRTLTLSESNNSNMRRGSYHIYLPSCSSSTRD